VRSRALARFGVVVGAAVIATIVAAGPAFATDTVYLLEGKDGTTAVNEEHSCDNVPGGARVGTDGWVFVLPKSGGDAGANFVTLTLKFLEGTTEHTVVVTSGGVTIDGVATANAGGIIDDNGTSKAWVEIPLGWAIEAPASHDKSVATVDGTNHLAFFTVTHVCQGTKSSPSPSSSSSPSPSSSNSSGTTPANSSSSSGGGLPTTGTSVTGFIIAGVVLLAGGGLLLFLRRRRDVFVSE
jgi:LPXTG-motif cell wall-anchored protein